MTTKIEIVDVIQHRWKHGVQTEVVLNRMPNPLFTRQGMAFTARGLWLYGVDDCIRQFYHYEKPGPNWQAFAGRKFDIPMADGTVEKAFGQWWDETPEHVDIPTYRLGLCTIEKLSECNVFYGGFHIAKNLVDEWLRNNEPSNNYHKYDKRHAEYGKHRIVSKWDLEVGHVPG